MSMVGKQDGDIKETINSTMVGIGSSQFSGLSFDVRYAGKMHVEGTITAFGHSKPMQPSDQDIGRNRLVVTRASGCKVSGTAQVQPGVTLTWSAQRKGAC